MKLSQLLRLLLDIECRHAGREIEVEARDSDGYLMRDFAVRTEYILAPGRITVRFYERDEEVLIDDGVEG